MIAVDLDGTPARNQRVNNGTPRPLTVHQHLLDTRPEWVVNFLALTLKAANWAELHPEEVRTVVAQETQAPVDKLEQVYGQNFHSGLHPDLSAERLELISLQKGFLLRHGFIDRDFSIEGWAAFEPLREALRLVS